MDPGDLHHGCTRLRQVLVVLAQPTIPPQPSERSFYDPTAPQGDEAPLAGGTTHHPGPVRSLMHAQPAVQGRAVVLVIRLDHFQAGEVFARQLLKQLLRRLGVVHVGGRDHDGQHEPHGIHHDMTFAAPDLLAPVGADILPAQSGLDRLAVDTTDARVGVPARGRTHLPTQGGEDLVPGAVPLPGVEVVVDGLPGREVVRQGAPGAAFAVEVKDSVDDLAQVGLAWAPTGSGWRKPGLKESPLDVRLVRRIGFAFHTSLYANTPFWNRLLDVLATTSLPSASFRTTSLLIEPGVILTTV